MGVNVFWLFLKKKKNVFWLNLFFFGKIISGGINEYLNQYVKQTLIYQKNQLSPSPNTGKLIFFSVHTESGGREPNKPKRKSKNKDVKKIDKIAT